MLGTVEMGTTLRRSTRCGNAYHRAHTKAKNKSSNRHRKTGEQDQQSQNSSAKLRMEADAIRVASGCQDRMCVLTWEGCGHDGFIHRTNLQHTTIQSSEDLSG
jgi:hypothetical protein